MSPNTNGTRAGARAPATAVSLVEELQAALGAIKCGNRISAHGGLSHRKCWHQHFLKYKYKWESEREGAGNNL